MLNKQALAGRLFWESFDAGVTEMYYILPRFITGYGGFGYPAQGTQRHWYHLIQPHEDFGTHFTVDALQCQEVKRVLSWLFCRAAAGRNESSGWLRRNWQYL